MSIRALMIQGTASDVGKSTVVAGLCRILRRRGVRVAPFKPQNMALNSAVGADGGEFGRAQALQAQAAGIIATADLNPVLLKPGAGGRTQVILQGRVAGELAAGESDRYRARAQAAVLDAFGRLRRAYEVIVIEGAGSPAEINLRAGDIANMGFAEAVDCRVALVADIERGGVFAHIAGTLALLSDSERARTSGFLINRFHGEVRLLQPGIDWLSAHTGKPCFGVLPYLPGLRLDAEDSLRPIGCAAEHHAARLRVVVPRIPKISNHTDFEPLAAHPQVALRYVGEQAPPPADLVILPGSKAVRADLAWLRAHGWSEYLARHLRYGGHVLGICGGLQMLGLSIADPNGLEGAAGESAGFGWLDSRTIIRSEKRLRNVTGRLTFAEAAVRGYEIHMGRSEGAALERPAVRLDDGTLDGAMSPDGQVLGTYLHGIFESPDGCAALLRWAGLRSPVLVDHDAERERMLERLADHIESHCDLDSLLAPLA